MPTKVYLVKAMVFPVAMCGYERWIIKKAEHQRIDAFELRCWRRLLPSPLDYKEIQPVNPKGNRSWIVIGRTDAEAEMAILWPPDVKNWLIGKDLNAGQEWRQEKVMTEDEMVGWHHQLDGYECKQAPGIGDGRGIWHAAVHGVAKCQTWLSSWTELNRQVWPCITKYSRAKANRVLPRELTGHSGHHFKQHKRGLYRWTSPDSLYGNQIDYILCS